ncbi:hypothetical protein [Longimicrobium sp.]|uniref:hypothetical protein n=1 Tax=Longimicrobium sp. TaxID=2029185 RepID=UPI002E300FE2|nr:hypothetical protein [Longimicrobium sp.]HEX6042468.1 hypothetical protein [Longimicrobium sp.]
MARRTPQLPTPPRFPTAARVHELYEGLLARPNVAGCFVGQKRMGNRYGSEVGVVAVVHEKVPRDELGADEMIPGALEWRRNSREQVSVVTDVQPISDAGFQAGPFAGPGDALARVTFPNRPGQVVVSTVGVALRHPKFGAVITTAGHALQGGPGTVTYRPGHAPEVLLQNVGEDGARVDITGEVVRSVRVEEADYALIVPTDGTPIRNLYHDIDSLGGLFVPQPDDVGKRFFALSPQGVKDTRLRGVFGVLTIEGFTLRDLLITDMVTQAGDSGCALIDASFRVCGLLVGFAVVDGVRRSVFMSAFWALSMEGAEIF